MSKKVFFALFADYVYVCVYIYIYATLPSCTHALCLNRLGSSSCPYKPFQSPLFLVMCEVHRLSHVHPIELGLVCSYSIV